MKEKILHPLSFMEVSMKGNELVTASSVLQGSNWMKGIELYPSSLMDVRLEGMEQITSSSTSLELIGKKISNL